MQFWCHVLGYSIIWYLPHCKKFAISFNINCCKVAGNSSYLQYVLQEVVDAWNTRQSSVYQFLKNFSTAIRFPELVIGTGIKCRQTPHDFFYHLSFLHEQVCTLFMIKQFKQWCPTIIPISIKQTLGPRTNI